SQKRPAGAGGGYVFGGRDGAVEGLVRTGREILGREKEFLSRHASSIQAPLRWRNLSGWVRAFHEDEDWEAKSAAGGILRRILADPGNGLAGVRLAGAVLDDPKADRAWDALFRRLDAVTELPAYEALDL